MHLKNMTTVFKFISELYGEIKGKLTYSKRTKYCSIDGAPCNESAAVRWWIRSEVKTLDWCRPRPEPGRRPLNTGERFSGKCPTCSPHCTVYRIRKTDNNVNTSLALWVTCKWNELEFVLREKWAYFDPSPTGFPQEPGRRSSSPPLSHRLWLDAV